MTAPFVLVSGRGAIRGGRPQRRTGATAVATDARWTTAASSTAIDAVVHRFVHWIVPRRVHRRHEPLLISWVELGHLVVDLLALLHQLLDLLDGVDDRRVVAAAELAGRWPG